MVRKDGEPEASKSVREDESYNCVKLLTLYTFFRLPLSHKPDLLLSFPSCLAK